jgi:hypothetical protein
MKICQEEDDGFICPMKSNPHLKKEKSGKIGHKGIT